MPTGMQGGGFINNDTIRGVDVLSEYSVATLSSSDEDVKDFSSVVFSENGEFVYAAGGGMEPHGVYCFRLSDIQKAAVEGQSTEAIRGAMQEFKLPLGKRCGVHKLAVSQFINSRLGNSQRFLFSSNNGWDHSVRLGVVRHGLLDVERTYSGHRDLVTSIVTPHANTETSTFVTTSHDGTACLWGGDQPGRPIYRWRCDCSPVAAYDCTGTVVAVTRSSDAVDLYDKRKLYNYNLNHGQPRPLATFNTGIPLAEDVLSMSFLPYSHQGARTELLSVTGTRTTSLIDTSGPEGASNVYQTETSGATCLLPDGAVSLRGSDSGTLHFANASTGNIIKSADTGLTRPLTAAAFSHSYWAAAIAAGPVLQCIVWPYNNIPTNSIVT